MRNIRKTVVLSLTTTLTVLAVFMVYEDRSSSPSKSYAERETLSIPTKQNDIFKEDIRFKITLPSAFLHQRGETWKPPIGGVSFALDTRNYSATKLAPVENEAVVVVSLKVVYFDAVDAGFNPANPRYIPVLPTLWKTQIGRRYGLNYFPNAQYPGAPPEEFLFDDGPSYKTMIHCQPSGNAYPSQCLLTTVGERGGGVNPQANAAIMTEILFRYDRLTDWSIINQQVKKFLEGKIVVSEWEN